MSERKFTNGDRVMISQTPVDSSDTRYSGMVGTVEELTHKNGSRSVYRVLLDDEDYQHSFYTEDLLPYGELEALREELAQAEAKVVSLKEAIRLKERNATELPFATVISYKDTFGPAVITKQAEDDWLNVFPTQSGNVNTERLDDSTVTLLLGNRDDAVVRKP